MVWSEGDMGTVRLLKSSNVYFNKTSPCLHLRHMTLKIVERNMSIRSN